MDNELLALARQLGELLTTRQEKIATAESCTGGGIAYIITEIPGSSLWFDRGFVTYSNPAKIQMLAVNIQTLKNYGAVSEQTALEMVTGALNNSDADYAVAVTGITGPEGGTDEKPVGTVYIAWGKKNKQAKVSKQSFSGTREKIRAQTIKMSLMCIINEIGKS